ncbi:MAG: isoprenylcysteine carboxyl methyltransferase family protein [Alphaproteobacteria bacterium]
MTAGIALILLVAAQRLAELVFAARNARRLMVAGAVEAGRAHYPVVLTFHGAWLAANVLAALDTARFDVVALAVFVVLQAARSWVIATLGARWTTRIIVTAGRPLERRGPYRWLDHPNYLVVAGEVAALPMVLGAWPIALAFSALHVPLLVHRIRTEDAALEAAGLRLPSDLRAPR